MPWKANLESFKKENGMIHADVVFINDETGEKLPVTYQGDNLDDKLLGMQAKSRIKSLESCDVAFPKLTIGPIAIPEDQDAPLA